MADKELRRKARLRTSLTAQRPILINEARLTQVFLNLLLNASHAIDDQQAEANTISVTSADENGSVVVEITDTGAGIAAEHLSRIFDPFFTTKPIGVGTGLGLAITHAIVTEAGGTISVLSTLGKGTTFRLRFTAASL